MIVFDFDKTLTKKDTLLGFYSICNSNKIIFCFKRFVYFFFQLFHKLKIIDNDYLKKLGILLFLKGKSKNFIDSQSIKYSSEIELNKVFDKYFKSNYYKNVNDIIVISASFECYIKPLFDLSEISVFGSQLKYSNDNIVEGININLYGKNKKKFVLNDLKEEMIHKLYTDSISDLPLASISKDIVLIKNNQEHQIKNVIMFKTFFKRVF